MTSCEPMRRAPYASDLKWRIVWQRIGMEHSYRSIAAKLNVGLGTVYNTLKRFRNTGDVIRAQSSSSRAAIMNHWTEMSIIQIVIEHPGYYLQETCQAIEQLCGQRVSPATVCRVIRRHGFTRKKLNHTAKQRSAKYRGEYLAEIQMYNRDSFVFIDETGFNSKDHTRRFGYAMRGENARDIRWLHRGTRISAIAAISSTGLLEVELTTGSVNGDKFFDFVRGSLIPHMLPYDGTNEKSIAVLDNCSIHHTTEVATLFRSAGIVVLYLPPYSPDLMPIEETFSYIKYYLKEHDEVWQAMDNPIPLIQAAFDSIQAVHCGSWIQNCGYP